jgi:hypothetical protein
VIAHVILYQPRPDLTDVERLQFMDALRAAVTGIPGIRSVRLGDRRLLGVSYEQAMSTSFDHFGMLEFDDERALRAYLEHPAHRTLGQLFWSCSSRTLVFDYELTTVNPTA